MSRRISRGTPYILTQAELENMLGSITPRQEEQIAALLEMSVEDWRKQPKAKRAKQMVDFQNRGQWAASMAAAAKAQTDLEATAFAVTMQTKAQSLSDDVAALSQMVHQLVEGKVTK